MYLKCALANVVDFEHNLTVTASSRTTRLTETVANTDKSVDAAPHISSDLMSSVVQSRKQKAILLPADYHAKKADRKVENGKLEVLRLCITVY